MSEPHPLGTHVSDGPVASHSSKCFGCGEDNAAGPNLTMSRQGEVLKGTVTLDERHQGARGLAHGGVLAALLDDACGAILMVLWEPAVTARLEVDYRAPARLGVPLDVTAWMVSRDGRKLRFRGEIHDGDTLVAAADALFLVVDKTHFKAARERESEDPYIAV